jgi:hypothetical protein
MRAKALSIGLACWALATVPAARGDEPAALPPATTEPSAPPLDALAGLSAPVAERTGGFFLSGEYLLLRPHREGMEIGVVVPSQSAPAAGCVESLSWATTSGFRAGGGYRFGDGWDVGAFFTYFHSPSQRTLDAPDGGFVLATLSQAGTSVVGSADADSGLGYGVLDIEVGKSFRTCDSLGVRLFGGARIARIDQSLKCIYTGGLLGDSSDYINAPSKFTGAGFTAGGEATWNFYGNWGLYGRARLSLLSGESRNQYTETVDAAAPLIDLHARYDLIVPVVEMGTGVSYRGRHVFASAGYDLVNWVNLINGLNFSGSQVDARRNDLMLEALSLKVGFTY